MQPQASDRTADLREMMRRIDLYVYDPRKRPFEGWYEDKASRGVMPVIQQSRPEFEEFLRQLITMGVRGTAVQIGLGNFGGTHFALRQIFDRVVTIDCDQGNIERFMAFNQQTMNHDHLIFGNSLNTNTIQKAYEIAGNADLVFIDGDHMFLPVLHDWKNFQGIVKIGGLVCFHDSVARPADYNGCQVDVFLSWLEHQPFRPASIERIGNALGIAYYVRQEASDPPASIG